MLLIARRCVISADLQFSCNLDRRLVGLLWFGRECSQDLPEANEAFLGRLSRHIPALASDLALPDCLALGAFRLLGALERLFRGEKARVGVRRLLLHGEAVLVGLVGVEGRALPALLSGPHAVLVRLLLAGSRRLELLSLLVLTIHGAIFESNLALLNLVDSYRARVTRVLRQQLRLGRRPVEFLDALFPILAQRQRCVESFLRLADELGARQILAALGPDSFAHFEVLLDGDSWHDFDLLLQIILIKYLSSFLRVGIRMHLGRERRAGHNISALKRL